MKSICPTLPLVALFSLAAVSCGDDPEQVAKLEKQRAEIVDIKGDLEIIEESLKQLPPDVTEELAEAKKVSEKQSAEVALLEAEVEALEEQKRALQAEFDAYQVKYRAK